MHISPRDMGWIEVIVGPMFSGKTEELIRRLRRAMYARQEVRVFKPQLDKRFSDNEIVSRNQMKLQSTLITNPADILEQVGDCDVVGIDEVQFFPTGIVQVADRLANEGKRVIVAGLDLDFAAQPFSHVSELLSIAEYIEKTLAICVVCGNPASRSQRLVAGGSERIVVGDVQAYEARCRKCFSPTPV
ncbi:thymidine kinase [Myxococcota bacterium]|nr:thymidine kinase [Myxococcota bacterium]MBU1244393.1 thymidine kinase [Myxococcota bacterium]MBU1411222.1 thymidine kinase [Myxococcota bacterium]PKN24927.1 MAG: thymidine kinase [Deltaproteobacteria bacterium HGW-Deltaproteobacteria-22]